MTEIPRLTERVDVALDPVLSLGILYDFEVAPGTVLCVDRDLKIRYLNPAWYQFMDLTGEPAASELGSGLCDGFQSKAGDYFTRALERVFEEKRPLEIDYECACRDAYRLYHLTASRLGDRYLVLNHELRFTLPHPPQEASSPPTTDNVAEQCPQCLRFRAEGEATWHWVNAWVPQPPSSDLDRSLCDNCLANYRPGVPI